MFTSYKNTKPGILALYVYHALRIVCNHIQPHTTYTVYTVYIYTLYTAVKAYPVTVTLPSLLAIRSVNCVHINYKYINYKYSKYVSLRTYTIYSNTNTNMYNHIQVCNMQNILLQACTITSYHKHIYTSKNTLCNLQILTKSSDFQQSSTLSTSPF